jgi:hypothetical protein
VSPDRRHVQILAVRFRKWDDAAVRRVVQECGGVVEKLTPELRMARVSPAPDADIEGVRQRLAARSEVEAATYALRMNTRGAYHAATNDTHLDLHYHLKRTNVFHAWKYTRGDPSVRVAVVDTGLVHSAVVAPTGNGDCPLPDSSYRSEDNAAVPWDYGEGDCESTNVDYSHGTTCWAIIKALANNGSGIAGIAPDCYGIMVAAAASTYPDVISIYAAEGIIEATNRGARIISCSWGQVVPVDANEQPTNQNGWDLINAVQYALDHGVLVINAAGNLNEYYPSANSYGPATSFMWPAEVDGVLLVSSAGGPPPHPEDTPYNGAGATDGPAYGAGIEVVTPAQDVFTALGPGYVAPSYANIGPDYGYGAWWDGLVVANGQPYGGGPLLTHHHSTSFSAPQVAGAAALILSINPALTAEQVKAILKSSGGPVSHAGVAVRYPSFPGILDTGKAVTKALATLPANAGRVFPYARFIGTGVVVSVSGGVATTTLPLNQPITLDAAGFSSDPITGVEVWVGSRRVYSGTGGTATVTITQGGPVRVVARTATTETSETYSDVGTAPTYALTIQAGTVSGAAVTAWGTRAADSTIAVTAPGASVGVVGYPDSTSWQATVSDLPSGATTITASDGTDSASVTVQAGARPHTIRATAGADSASFPYSLPLELGETGSTVTLVPGCDTPPAVLTSGAGAVALRGALPVAAGNLTAGAGAVSLAGLRGLPAAAGTLATPGAKALGALGAVSANGTTSAQPVSFTATPSGHRLRATADGAPAYVWIVPGADAGSGLASSGAGAVAIGAQVPAPRASGAFAAASVAVLSGAGVAVPAAGMTSGAGAISIAAVVRAPSAAGVLVSAPVSVAIYAAPLGVPAAGATSGAESIGISAVVPVPIASGLFSATPIGYHGGAFYDEDQAIDAVLVRFVINAKPTHIHADARKLSIATTARRYVGR